MLDLRKLSATTAFSFALGSGLAQADSAGSNDLHLIFNTSDVNVLQAGAIEGKLNITVAPDGTIQGTFRPSESADRIDVDGSLQGNKITLHIGWDGAPIIGTYENGKIDAYVLEGDREHRFTGTPATGI
jgi:uncharacterized protein involved in outer membrane biogenesis